MSILNVALEDQAALVAVDTQSEMVIGDRDARPETSKLVPMVHGNMVLALRGNLDLLRCVFFELWSRGGGFDEALVEMPEVLNIAAERVLEGAARHGVDSSWVKGDLALVGWSHSAQAMRARRYAINGRDEISFSDQAAWTWFAAPGDPFAGRLSEWDLSTEQGIKRAALRQVQWCRAAAPDRATGGRLLIARVRKGQILVNDAGAI